MELEHGHTTQEIRQRLDSPPQATYLRDWIYGGIDGTVTTFAVAAGAAGASLSPAIVLVLGFANLFADGFSMAAGNFASTKAEREDYERLLAVERRHIALVPDGEREEVRQIFARKGFEGEALERIVQTITANEPAWAREMVLGEYGQAPAVRRPLTAALCTFSAFVLFGLVPLLPYLIGSSFTVSAMATGVTFLVIGAAKSRWSLRPAWRSGLETLAIGGSAAAVAFITGNLLARWVG